MDNNTNTDYKMPVLAAIHGTYYFISGLWPILHMTSFMAVTGPKLDLWLVETVGVLVLFIGLGLLTAAQKNEVSFPLSIIAAGSALGLTCIDVIYVWLGVISPVYLLDAVIELILLTAWVAYIYKSRMWKK